MWSRASRGARAQSARRRGIIRAAFRVGGDASVRPVSFVCCACRCRTLSLGAGRVVVTPPAFVARYVWSLAAAAAAAATAAAASRGRDPRREVRVGPALVRRHGAHAPRHGGRLCLGRHLAPRRPARDERQGAAAVRRAAPHQDAAGESRRVESAGVGSGRVESSRVGSSRLPGLGVGPAQRDRCLAPAPPSLIEPARWGGFLLSLFHRGRTCGAWGNSNNLTSKLTTAHAIVVDVVGRRRSHAASTRRRSLSPRTSWASSAISSRSR